MHSLFEMTVNAGFDAASHQGHSWALGCILRDVGDRFFGECLAAEPAAVQLKVREDLLYDMGYDGDYAEKGEWVNGQYPKTFPDSSRL